LCITEKSERHMSHVDEPNDGPSAAAAIGVSRSAGIESGRCRAAGPSRVSPSHPEAARPSIRRLTTSGIPRSVAVRFMCAIFLLFVALVDAPLTVKSLTTIATSRPSILP
jgi:hypothetical protein